MQKSSAKPTVLIANRGEIALRIIRACHKLDLQTVVVHSLADSESMPVKLADQAICIGPEAASKSYLNPVNILAAAHVAGADLIHPGIGFLAENAQFAELVEQHGFTFVGPKPEHIRDMGDKIRAKETAKSLGLPLVPGSMHTLKNADHAAEEAKRMGYPVLLKAVNGGGGKGMRIVESAQDIYEAYNNASAEALAAFASGDMYIEKFVKNPRHIEVQVLCDGKGQYLFLGERDCSLQRRHQKIWEEAPSPALSKEQRQHLHNICVKAMRNMGYKSAGTLEFLFDGQQFYFIEMNTRLQVEHTITEEITGIDIVAAQLCVALGRPLNIKQKDIAFKGHAIQCRINAEHASTFCPSPGLIQSYLAPGGPGIRVDSHMYSGYVVPPYYDSLIAKLIAKGETRSESLQRMKQALEEYVIEGVQTLIPLHRILANDPHVQQGRYHTGSLEEWLTKMAAEKNNSTE